MANREPLTDDDGEVRELTAEDFALFRPFSELPEEHKRILRGLKRGAQKEPTKELISIRLSPAVLQGLRATGPGWQGRADKALAAWLKRQPRTIKTAPTRRAAKRA